MTETGSEAKNKIEEPLLSAWSRATEQVFERMTSVKPQLEWQSHESASPDTANLESLEWWEARYEAEGDPRVWVGVPGPAVLELGRLAEALTAAKESAAAEPTPAVREMMQSLSTAFGELLGEQVGRAVRCQSLERLEATPSPEVIYSTKIELPGKPELPILVGFKTASNTTFQQLLEHLPQQPGKPEAAGQYNRSLGLLLEMELPLSVRFGQVTMPIENVLELRAGANIELDRALEDQVELVVNGTVVAKGEIVAVEGNYGIRVLEVLSRDCRVDPRQQAS